MYYELHSFISPTILTDHSRRFYEEHTALFDVKEKDINYSIRSLLNRIVQGGVINSLDISDPAKTLLKRMVMDGEDVDLGDEVLELYTNSMLGRIM